MDLPRCSAVILDVCLMGIIRQSGIYIRILIVGIRFNFACLHLLFCLLLYSGLRVGERVSVCLYFSEFLFFVDRFCTICSPHLSQCLSLVKEMKNTSA